MESCARMMPISRGWLCIAIPLSCHHQKPGVMVVSPQPQSALRNTKPIELQKLDKVPKVGSIKNKWYCVHLR